MNKLRLLQLAILLSLLVLGIVGFLVFYARPLAIAVAQPEENVPVQFYGLGTVEARVVSDVGFEIGNTLIELHVDHGDRVAEGEVLARLHQPEPRTKGPGRQGRRRGPGAGRPRESPRSR